MKHILTHREVEDIICASLRAKGLEANTIQPLGETQPDTVEYEVSYDRVKNGAHKLTYWQKFKGWLNVTYY